MTHADPLAAQYWYAQALAYLPAYTHARVHSAELHLDVGQFDSALTLLQPIKDSSDPEVSWRLAQLYVQTDQANEARYHLARTQHIFEHLLAHHALAFADHAVDFYLEEGNDPGKALQLALLNLNNRATLKAFVLSHEAAKANEQHLMAQTLADRAAAQWGHLPAFKHSAVNASQRAELNSAPNATLQPEP
jgi:hypothetical protein